MPDTTTATLTRHAADTLRRAFGTAGRPAVVGFTKDEHGNMVLVYADGCLARRVPCFQSDPTLQLSLTNGWQWEAMEGPSYDALFVRETGAADD